MVGNTSPFPSLSLSLSLSASVNFRLFIQWKENYPLDLLTSYDPTVLTMVSEPRFCVDLVREKKRKESNRFSNQKRNSQTPVKP
jgi:hypothetical protein